MPDDDMAFEVSRVPCPGCGLRWGHTPPDAAELAVMHELPVCDDFASRDTVSWLRWINHYLAQLARDHNV